MTRLPDTGLGFLLLQLHPVPKSQGCPGVSAVGFCVLSVCGPVRMEVGFCLLHLISF